MNKNNMIMNVHKNMIIKMTTKKIVVDCVVNPKLGFQLPRSYLKKRNKIRFARVSLFNCCISQNIFLFRQI